MTRLSLIALLGAALLAPAVASAFDLEESLRQLHPQYQASERPDLRVAKDGMTLDQAIESVRRRGDVDRILDAIAPAKLLAFGVYNPWVQKSLDRLAILMPGRYAKNEISGGYLGSIDTYAYRMPIAPPIGIDPDGGIDEIEPGENSEPPAATAQMSDAEQEWSESR